MARTLGSGEWEFKLQLARVALAVPERLGGKSIARPRPSRDKSPMRARTLLLISLVLNVALISALVTWLSSAPQPAPQGARPINPYAAISNQPVRIVKTNILVRPRTFTWQEVESADYAVYVENLRALGMPETTIRDIIVADVDQIYLQRQREDAARQDFEWWRSVPSLEMQSNLLARAESIESERAALLVKLLGPDWAKDRPRPDEMPFSLGGPVLSALSDEVKASVQEIAQRSRARMAEYVAGAEARGEALNAREMARIRDETRQQLAAVLPAAALEEFLIQRHAGGIPRHVPCHRGAGWGLGRPRGGQ
jgi:hypothetical protein